MVIGGEPLGPRHIWWNFVSSSKERIERAKRDWTKAASEGARRRRVHTAADREPRPVEQIAQRRFDGGPTATGNVDRVAAAFEARATRRADSRSAHGGGLRLRASCRSTCRPWLRQHAAAHRRTRQDRVARVAHDGREPAIPPSDAADRGARRGAARTLSARVSRIASRILRSATGRGRHLAGLLDGPVVTLVAVTAQLVGRLAAIGSRAGAARSLGGTRLRRRARRPPAASSARAAAR